MLTMILPPVPGSSTVAGYVLVTYPATAMWGTSAWAPGPRCPRQVPHIGVGTRAGLLVLDAPSHPYLAYRPGVPLTAAVRCAAPPRPPRLRAWAADAARTVGDRGDERGRPRLRTVSCGGYVRGIRRTGEPDRTAVLRQCRYFWQAQSAKASGGVPPVQLIHQRIQ